MQQVLALAPESVEHRHPREQSVRIKVIQLPYRNLAHLRFNSRREPFQHCIVIVAIQLNWPLRREPGPNRRTAPVSDQCDSKGSVIADNFSLRFRFGFDMELDLISIVSAHAVDLP